MCQIIEAIGLTLTLDSGNDKLLNNVGCNLVRFLKTIKIGNGFERKNNTFWIFILTKKRESKRIHKLLHFGADCSGNIGPIFVKNRAGNTISANNGRCRAMWTTFFFKLNWKHGFERTLIQVMAHTTIGLLSAKLQTFWTLKGRCYKNRQNEYLAS